MRKINNLPKSVAWINNPVFKSSLIFGEVFPNMKNYYRFEVLICGNSIKMKPKQLNDGELEEFAYMMQDVKNSMLKLDFYNVNFQKFTEMYLKKELKSIDYKGAMSVASIRRTLKSKKISKSFKTANKNAVNKLFKPYENGMFL